MGRRREWHDVLMETARSIADRDYEAALDQLSGFLGETESQDERSEALALRGTVLVRLGDPDAARCDLELAHSLSRPAGYQRYALELLLADAARMRGDVAEARTLFARALETASDGSSFSAGSALEGIVALTEDGERSGSERALIRRAIDTSWRTLRLAPPIPDDVAACVRRIVGAEREA
jgi:ATP/maltotriose-dependent transcriptional regulator MalT